MQVWSADADDKVQSIKRIGRIGKSSDAKGEFNFPSGICCSPDGSIYVVEQTINECKDLMPVVDSSSLLEVMAGMKINFKTT